MLIDKAKETLYSLKGSKDATKEYLELAKKDLAKIDIEETAYKDARTVVLSVLSVTHESVKKFIEDTTTMALRSIFGDRYRFVIKYNNRKDRSEAICSILDRDNHRSVDGGVGGGIIDVVSLGVRLSLWTIGKPQSDRVFMLDEPLKFVSRDKSNNVGYVLKQLSQMLGIQLNIISHDDEIINSADRSFLVTKPEDTSLVKCLDEK